jgi:dTDP-glucose pyrophosphorylase
MDAKILEAVRVLNDTGLGIVLVIEPSGKLIGTITDGDIRRGLLCGLSLNSSIKEVVHRDPIVVNEKVPRSQILKLMVESKVQQIPMVGEDFKVLGMHLWDDLHTQQLRSNKMVIMAGGRGSRLYPETATCPKPMLKINEKPILQHIIERAKLDGIHNFVIAVHYLSEIIKDYFGDGQKFGVSIEYLEEKSPLGTAGALSLLKSPQDSDILVTNGDLITEIKYGELLDYHIAHSAFATMAVKSHEYKNPFGVVEIRNLEIRDYQEKPVTISQVNAGIYVLSPQSLDLLQEDQPCDMSTLFQCMLAESQKVVAYPLYEDWRDIGNPIDLKEARIEHTQKVNDV